MLVIADGSDGCYDLGGERDDEREEERRRGDATTVTGPGATPVGGTSGHSLAAQSRPGFGSEHAILGFYYLSSEKMWQCAKVIQERVLSCCPIQTGWSSAHSSRDSKSWNNKRIPHIPWSACTWPSANWLLNERPPDWPGSTLTTEDLSSKNAFTFVKRMAVATFWWWGYTITLIKDIQNYNLQIVLIDLNVRGARFEPRS